MQGFGGRYQQASMQQLYHSSGQLDNAGVLVGSTRLQLLLQVAEKDSLLLLNEEQDHHVQVFQHESLLLAGEVVSLEEGNS